MTAHRFTPEQVHHVDQAHGDAVNAAVTGLAILRLAERAASAEAIPTWWLEEQAQKYLEAMDVDSQHSPGRRNEDPSGPDSDAFNSSDSDDSSGRNSTTGENHMGGTNV